MPQISESTNQKRPYISPEIPRYPPLPIPIKIVESNNGQKFWVNAIANIPVANILKPGIIDDLRPYLSIRVPATGNINISTADETATTFRTSLGANPTISLAKSGTSKVRPLRIV